MQSRATVAVPGPADAGAEVRHAGQFQVGNFLARIEIDYLAADYRLGIIARGTHHFVITLREVEIVEIIVELGTHRIEESGYEGAFLVLEVVDHAGRNVVRTLEG